MLIQPKPLPRFLILLSIIFASAAMAQDKKKTIDVDDYFSQSFITEVACSPNGEWVCYGELRWNPPAESRNGDLWTTNTKTKEVRRLTFDDAGDGHPQWSGNGKWIFFTSARKNGTDKAPYNGKTQIWKVNIEDGRILPVTRLPQGVTDFRYDGGDVLHYTTSGKADDDPWAHMRKKFGELNYGDTTRDVSEVWKLDMKTWRTTKLVAPNRYIFAWAVSPNHERIAMITTKDSKLVSYEGWSNVEVFDVASGETTTLDDTLWREKAPSPYGWLETPTWASENKLAFRIAYDGYPAEVFVSENTGNGFQSFQLERPNEAHIYNGSVRWIGDNLYFTAQDQARERLYEVANVGNGTQGAARILTPGDVYVFDYSIAKENGTLAIMKADPKSGRDVFLVTSEGYDQLTETNPQMKDWELPTIQIVKWKSNDGTEVQGILELPPGYKPEDGPLPTILHIHGGPTSATPYCFRFWPYGRTLLPSKGMAIFSPNYRGSTGYGDKFMIDLVGRENDIDVQDLLSGVDHLVNQGIADPKRLGVMGWSNGGFLTNAIIGKSDKFIAASSGAGVIDQVMQWALEDTPGHVINYMGGKMPWQNPSEYQESSPLFNLANTTTPTLIHVGENDERVPAAHAKTLFRALHRYKGVPCQLVMYPNTGHSPVTYTHRKAKMEWDVAWFEKYLLGKDEE